MTISDHQPSANTSGKDVQKPFLSPEEEEPTIKLAAQQKSKAQPFVTAPPQRPQRNKKLFLVFTLLMLVIIVILGGFAGQRLMSGNAASTPSPTAPSNLHFGSFAQQP